MKEEITKCLLKSFKNSIHSRNTKNRVGGKVTSINYHNVEDGICAGVVYINTDLEWVYHYDVFISRWENGIPKGIKYMFNSTVKTGL